MMVQAIELKEVFNLYRKMDRRWWEKLPLRYDFSLLLAKDKEFWRREGENFGWFSEKTPYECAVEELTEIDLKSARWFYEESGIFDIPLCRSKVGSWCYWVSIRSLTGS